MDRAEHARRMARARMLGAEKSIEIGVRFAGEDIALIDRAARDLGYQYRAQYVRSCVLSDLKNRGYLPRTENRHAPGSCPYCGSAVSDGTVFCTVCGKKL